MQVGRSSDSPLLTVTDGPSAEVLNMSGRGAFLVVCEHASNRLPAALGDLGLTPDLLQSHIAWDPGAMPVARALSRLLDSPLVAGRFSRLAYDCNRPPEATDAIAARSEVFEVPGNAELGAGERRKRVDEIYAPFREALAAEMRRRPDAAMVTVHSFTPVYKGVPRDVELGVLHDADARLADAVLPRAAAATGLRTARNQPYGPEDGVTHTLKEHALPAGALNVMLEIRNDLLSDEASCDAVAAALATALAAALDAVKASGKMTGG
jgi:predicted N-formylglutamate amidohydrolase